MKNIYLIPLFLFSFGLCYSQTQDSLSIDEQQLRENNIQAGNPFKKFGYKPKILTLSNGKYLEFHDKDSIVQIGSFTFHVKQKIITGYILKKTKYSEATLRPEVVSRWFSPDPLADEFPSWSPYVFTNDNPIFFTDPTGLAPETIYRNFATNEEVEVQDGIDKTIEVNDSDFQKAKFFANEINPTTNADGTTTINSVSSEIAEAYTSFYNSHNSFGELSFANVMDALFVRPKLFVDEAVGAAGGLELVGGSAVKTIQKHHIIPKKVYSNFKKLLSPIMKLDGGYNLKKLPTPFHGNHPQYNTYVENRIRTMAEQGNLTPGSLGKLQKELSSILNQAYDSGLKINEYFRKLN